MMEETEKANRILEEFLLEKWKLSQIKDPVLFIAGEHDVAIPLDDVLKQCHLPEKSYFHLLKESGHMGMMEETEKANQILEEFLLEKWKLSQKKDPNWRGKQNTGTFIGLPGNKHK